MEKQIIIDRIVKILSEALPVFKEIGSRQAKENCFEIGTLRNVSKLDDENCLHFCVLFEDESSFVPSIFCSIGRDDFSPEPGEVINVKNLEKGILDFISKSGVNKFLMEPLKYSQFATV